MVNFFVFSDILCYFIIWYVNSGCDWMVRGCVGFRLVWLNWFLILHCVPVVFICDKEKWTSAFSINLSVEKWKLHQFFLFSSTLPIVLTVIFSCLTNDPKSVLSNARLPLWPRKYSQVFPLSVEWWKFNRLDLEVLSPLTAVC